MKKRDYDTLYDETTGSTDTHLAVDTEMKRPGSEYDLGLEEGFASASGVRQETAETGGRIKHPESKDAADPDTVPDSIERENSGLAES